MFDSKMLLVILAIALVIFGTKRLRNIGTDLGGAVKGFKQALSEGSTDESASMQAPGAGIETPTLSSPPLKT